MVRRGVHALSHASRLLPCASFKIVSPGLMLVTLCSQHGAGTAEGQIPAQTFCLVQMQQDTRSAPRRGRLAHGSASPILIKISHGSADVPQEEVLPLPQSFACFFSILMRTSPMVYSLVSLSFEDVIRIDAVDRKF